MYCLWKYQKKEQVFSLKKNSSFHASERAWNLQPEERKEMYIGSARSAVDTIFAMEPNLIEESEDDLKLYIQSDNRGKVADVRDIIAERNQIRWEIGFSIKHNHFAAKHSRLSMSIDFGEKWYGIPCSQNYYDKIRPIFERLKTGKKEGVLFCSLSESEKQTTIYRPVLEAFIGEIKRAIKVSNKVPKRIIEYVLSKYDFYKIVSVDTKRLTIIQTFNLYGTLNRKGKIISPQIKVPVMTIPQEILYIDFKPNSENTVYLCFDNGWLFSFRIHNAEKVMTPSLKFDIKVEGMPTEVSLKFMNKW